MGTLRMRIGGDGPVVIETDATGWRLLVRGQIRAAGLARSDMHAALREIALNDRSVAHDAFGVLMNCAGAWEDDYTEEHGENALAFEDWMKRIESGVEHWVDDDGELRSSFS